MQINTCISIKILNKLKTLKGIVTCQIYSTKKYCTRDFRNGCFDI